VPFENDIFKLSKLESRVSTTGDTKCTQVHSMGLVCLSAIT